MTYLYRNGCRISKKKTRLQTREEIEKELFNPSKRLPSCLFCHKPTRYYIPRADEIKFTKINTPLIAVKNLVICNDCIKTRTIDDFMNFLGKHNQLFKFPPDEKK